MKRRIWLIAAVLGLSACGGEGGGGTSSVGSSNSSSGNTNLSVSEQAFQQTLYPILRDNCSICHNAQGADQAPLHADNDVAIAHQGALNVVDLDNPSSSRIVSRLRDDEHMCWTNCDTAADELASAITQWSGQVSSGNVSPIACDASFPQDLILLSDLPYVKSIATLLGDWVLEGRDMPDPATKLFSQKSTVANTSLVNSRLDWAAHAADNFQRRAVQVSGCFEADRNCAKSFIEDFAHKAFKRPLVSGESDDLMEIFDQGASSTFTNGLKLAVQAILVSPSFNHRTEYGAPNNEGTFTLTPHEFATTISFLLTDALPDDELLAAADSGALADPAERERQTLRLLSMASTRESMEYTMLSAWNMGNLFGKVKDPEMFPTFNGGLASQMYEETRLFLAEHLWKGTMADVLTSRKTFVNKNLADLYGINFPGSDPNQFYEVELDGSQRAGLLTQASLMTAYSRTDETSVVARGLFVNGPLLCLPDVPPPPESVVAEVASQLEDDATEVERAEFRAATTPCKDCHNQFDAYGLMFENYDAIGDFRDFDERGQAIHANVDLSTMASFSGSVDGPVQFADMIAQRPEFVRCVTRHLFAYGTGEDGISSNQCEVTSITRNLNSQSSLTDIIRAIVASPALSTRVEE